jgi:tight adherence protein B
LVQARVVAAGRHTERTRALEALAVLAADLRVGRGPADALAAAADVAVGGTSRALLAAASAARLGGDVPGALTAEPSAVSDVLRGLAACWTVCLVAGSGLASGVDRLTEGLRAAEAQRRAVDAELAGPRATALLLAALPLAGIGLAGALGADPLRVLLHTPAGVSCLIAGIALDAAGWLWTRRLVAGASGS